MATDQPWSGGEIVHVGINHFEPFIEALIIYDKIKTWYRRRYIKVKRCADGVAAWVMPLLPLGENTVQQPSALIPTYSPTHY